MALRRVDQKRVISYRVVTEVGVIRPVPGNQCRHPCRKKRQFAVSDIAVHLHAACAVDDAHQRSVVMKNLRTGGAPTDMQCETTAQEL